MSRVSKQEQQEAAERLRESLKPGDTVYTIVRHVSSSGMSRVIQVIAFQQHDRGLPPLWLGWNVAKALGWAYDQKHAGVKVAGCGMDMTFHLVRELSAALFGDANALKRENL